ncbi:MAG: tripartite tricarboxylate transporter TctB family protein [Candidatus Rokubacteria bacterium]|nr:tripartite tricarboxylate transporter TctB family protein [Candidatus Rokubacteria bacterium]MBI2158471.1 tripartite tricarboxylate transporter TctB family protein [Candidatus Rokubacteria bacterium]
MTAFAFLTAGAGALVAAVSALALGFGSLAEPGPGFFPCVVGLVLAAAGARTGVSTLRRTAGAPGAPPLGRSGVRRVLFMLASFVVWLLLLPAAGYVPGTFVVAIAMSRTVGLEGWIRPLLLSAALTVALYLLFDVFLYVDLPRGILG